MRIPLGAMIMSVALTTSTYAQSPPASTPGPAPSASVAPAAPAPATASPTEAAVPVQGTRRFACQTAAQSVQGQDRRDQMQLCIAQARVDCLKQAINQKIVGAERRDFVKNCVD